MVKPGDVISYLEMCREEGVNLQRGMNFRLRGNFSVILMSLRPGAPYADRIENNGKILIYEGHDIAQKRGSPNPETTDQPMCNPNGSLTSNGLFFEAANKYKRNHCGPELIKVYEKIRSGIWVYNGLFRLVDAWQEVSNARKVFKFRLELSEEDAFRGTELYDIDHNRIIPTSVKLEVWKRDKGKCVRCGSRDNLHFDHIIPYSKGGASLVAENIQLLCARHNLEKRDRIE
ncbi:MAG TPA: HNH endonuclease [Candidatus Avalokitesvara rifleensis]|uniref:HNH endonuclease n=1 Tax=Candidatus Avalokitesvara rifleensis TaxID=3367620 RepID=UPI002713B78C|nr:HNH endonuclease [Candidatus Brocadiales bacterium]